MDSNKDGKVSKDEAMTAGFSADEVAKMDTNKDGMLSQAEIDAAKKAKGKEGSCAGDKKGKEGGCGDDKKGGKEGGCGGHL
jgi:EF hand